jgi:hypothetical protein
MRLVSWNEEVLQRLLIQIVQRRLRKNRNRKGKSYSNSVSEDGFNDDGTKMVIDEVQEIIELPQIDPKLSSEELSTIKVELSQKVIDQLQMYVTEIAMLYNNNPCKCLSRKFPFRTDIPQLTVYLSFFCWNSS